MSAMPSCKPRPGFTLIEVLCVIVLIGVLGILIAMLLRSTMGVERAQAAGFNKTMFVSTLADQFRADVNRAEAALHEWQDYEANVRTLILKTKIGHIVYLWEDGKLLRRGFEEGQVSERTIPLGLRGLTEVELFRPGHGARTVRIRLHAQREGETLAGHSLEIAAALGGDWR